jgi:hypothetical protein
MKSANSIALVFLIVENSSPENVIPKAYIASFDKELRETALW